MTEPIPILTSNQLSTWQHGFNLFLVGFLVLFLELACIRWFAANVVFLQFFTNVALIASFLGMSCGCLASRQKRDWLGKFPLFTVIALLAALSITMLYNNWSGFYIDVGHQGFSGFGHQPSSQEIFFGTTYRNPDIAKFFVPIEVIAGLFFILIALMFIGLGQALGRAFDEYPDRVLGYTLNIGGSVVGILVFSALSFLQTPPAVWFFIISAGVVFLLRQSNSLTSSHKFLLFGLLVAITIPSVVDEGGYISRWSPYYLVLRNKTSGEIAVNTIGHQAMVPYAKSGSAYSLIHLLQKESGGEPFHDTLIIGAGSGNDIAHALQFGASRIDAVEIDPVIQDIGMRNHPDQPYQDPRVVPHLDDGRHFLKTTDRKFDLVEYARLDSLIEHSSYANIRLESYLFTRQAFEDVHRVLKPEGIFVLNNYFRNGWLVERISDMAKEVFGCEPLIFSLPYRDVLESFDEPGFTTIIAGCNTRIKQAFKQHGSFWLNDVPPQNVGIDGFMIHPDSLPPDRSKGYERISPTKLARNDMASTNEINDDWPFLYIKDKGITDLTIHSMILIGVLGIGMVYLFLPKGQGRMQINSRMFFLGAAFMLLETKAVVQMALLFGSTWLVNSAVFFAVLVLLLFANLYVLKVPSIRISRHYVCLMLFLLVTILIPFEAFLSGNILWRYFVPCVLALGPMFFAGVIFARSFKDTPNPDYAFGSNIAGSVVGGLAENFSTLLGFRYLLLLAIAFYVLSIWLPSLHIVKGRNQPN